MNENINSFDEEDIKNFTNIYNEVKLIADKKILDLHNHKVKNIDIDNIYVETQKEYFGNLLKEVEELFSYDRELIFKKAKFDDPIISEKFFQKMEEHGKIIANCNTWQELKCAAQKLPVSDEEKQALDTTGVRLFQEEEYLIALANFTLLCALDFNNAENWLKKGMAEQNFTSPERALKCYALAIYFDATLIPTYINIMECLILMHALDESKQVYDTFIAEINQASYIDDELICSKLNNIKNFLGSPVY